MRWNRPIPPPAGDRINSLIELNHQVREQTRRLVRQGRCFVFLSGDHSAAIGIWGGVMEASAKSGRRLGLIWIDAHMDAHTSATSPSGNPHGMPVAALLGMRDPLLDKIRGDQPVMEADQIILTGIHSYESVEKWHLDRLGVDYQLMTQIHRLGLQRALHQSWRRLSAHCDAIGISIDLDAIDPRDIPGVAVPVPNGIRLKSLLTALSSLPVPVALEISEFNPFADRKLKTTQSIPKIVRAVFS